MAKGGVRGANFLRPLSRIVVALQLAEEGQLEEGIRKYIHSVGPQRGWVSTCHPHWPQGVAAGEHVFLGFYLVLFSPPHRSTCISYLTTQTGRPRFSFTGVLREVIRTCRCCVVGSLLARLGLDGW